MKTARGVPITWFAMMLAICLLVGIAIRAQEPALSGDASNGPQRATLPASTEAQREQIWNSPAMLRARAWLQDYCSKSAKITPEQGKKYMEELANMTPSQMELWLVKFNHEEEQRQQQYSMWQQVHAAGISQALAANRATQQAYANINREESESAIGAQQQLNEQTQVAQNRAEDKQLELNAPYPYAYAGYGGVHYHFHLYPYPY